MTCVVGQSKRSLRNSADDSKLGGLLNIPNHCSGHAGVMKREMNFMNFNMGKYKVMHMKRNNLRLQHRMGAKLERKKALQKIAQGSCWVAN